MRFGIFQVEISEFNDRLGLQIVTSQPTKYHVWPK